jgi:hypothetical protein
MHELRPEVPPFSGNRQVTDGGGDSRWDRHPRHPDRHELPEQKGAK